MHSGSMNGCEVIVVYPTTLINGPRLLRRLLETSTAVHKRAAGASGAAESARRVPYWGENPWRTTAMLPTPGFHHLHHRAFGDEKAGEIDRLG